MLSRIIRAAFILLLVVPFVLIASLWGGSYWRAGSASARGYNIWAWGGVSQGVLLARAYRWPTNRLILDWHTLECKRADVTFDQLIRDSKPVLSVAGIMVRTRHNGATYLIRLPLWVPALFTSLPVLWLAYRWHRRPRLKPGHCRKCNYDLRAHKPGDRCPECGSEVLAKTA